jgi:magnesium chelatase subunit D
MKAASDASWVASLFAVDPVATAGVCLRSQVHPARDQWLRLLDELLPTGRVRRIPFNISDNRLLGGLDLAATLKANRPIAERGALAASDGGVVVITMAERLSRHTAACIGTVLDAGEAAAAREGVSVRHTARIGVVLLDEGLAEDEVVPHSLLDRLAFSVDLNGFSLRTPIVAAHERVDILAARELLPNVQQAPGIIESLCATALALGVESARAAVYAYRAAQITAALNGRTNVGEDDAILAARLVLAPRATTLAAPERASDPPATENSEPSAGDAPPPEELSEKARVGEMQSSVLAAAQAAIPPGLLMQLKAGGPSVRQRPNGGGRAGELRNAGARGRPAGVRSGLPQGGARLNVIETLRAAAPWQALRGRAAQGRGRLRIEASDCRVTRYQQKSRTLTVFVVDASGSAALHRLAEAKGAVELLLADCYIRRDQVALIAFRGRSAELLLPPTRSLPRAKRSLAGLPGGGATPLAAAIDAAVALARQAQRRGETPTLVMLTDGRANIARDGAPGREAAHADALKCASGARLSKIAALFIDTAPRPNALARDVAGAMGARYLALPFANSRALSDIVRAAAVRT